MLGPNRYVFKLEVRSRQILLFSEELSHPWNTTRSCTNVSRLGYTRDTLTRVLTDQDQELRPDKWPVLVWVDLGIH